MNATDTTVTEPATAPAGTTATDSPPGTGVYAGPMTIRHRGCAPSVHPDAYVAPTAVLSGQVSISAGSCILHGALAASAAAPLLGQWRGGRCGGLGGDETARCNPPMTHPGTQWLPPPIHRRRGCNLTGHGVPRRPARPPRWPRGRAPSPSETSVPGVPAATHTRYRPLTRAAPAGGAVAPLAHEHRAAAHAGEPARGAVR